MLLERTTRTRRELLTFVLILISLHLPFILIILQKLWPTGHGCGFHEWKWNSFVSLRRWLTRLFRSRISSFGRNLCLRPRSLTSSIDDDDVRTRRDDTAPLSSDPEGAAQNSTTPLTEAVAEATLIIIIKDKSSRNFYVFYLQQNLVILAPVKSLAILASCHA